MSYHPRIHRTEQVCVVCPVCRIAQVVCVVDLDDFEVVRYDADCLCEHSPRYAGLAYWEELCEVAVPRVL